MKKFSTILVGLGVSSMACARYLDKQGESFALVDTREAPPLLTKFQQAFPMAPLFLGSLDKDFLSQAEQLVVSPGISIRQPIFTELKQQGLSILGDIELFAQKVNAPVIAITGTNAKSTVTTLVGDMAKRAGLKTYVGGNLGDPVLNLLHDDAMLYVLELSSFQLETTYTLAPKVATVLNITPDHMDRYDSLQDYTNTKLRIYRDADVVVWNIDDPQTRCLDCHVKQISFGMVKPAPGNFGIVEIEGEQHLAFGDTALLAVNELPVMGQHYQANALAALALGYGFGLAFEPMLETLREFKGLPHRCQLVRERLGISWYNDSKGTNVGATLAAINGLGPVIPGKLILIAGGQGKNADFTELLAPVAHFAKLVVLIGEAAPMLGELFGKLTAISYANSMAEAVNLADQAATKGDAVLLSPACASLDMFKNFEHRGTVFVEAVQGML